MANERPNNKDQGLDLEALAIRTSASEAHRDRDRCRRCGEPVRGRRRNGYCGDRCRMKDNRHQRAARLNHLLTSIERLVGALRDELEGHHDA